MQKNIALSLILAFLGNSMIAVGQGIQKSQVQSIEWKMETAKKWKKVLIWICGILFSNGGLVFLYFAVAVGSSSMVGAMNASGLIALLFFSHFALKEKIDSVEIGGVAMIFAGVIAMFLLPHEPEVVVAFDPSALWVSTAITVTVLLCFAVLLKLINKPTGFALGLLAGSLSGAVVIQQRAASLGIETAIYIGISLAFYFFSFLSLQFAYRRNRIINVLPYYNALRVIVPIVGGQFLFGERLSVWQWAGIGTILAGMVMIFTRIETQTVQREEK